MYAFPLLEPATIVQSFQSFFPEWHFTIEDLQQPQRERWHKFFLVILCSVTGASPDNINQAPLDMDYQLPFSEFHQDAIPHFCLATGMAHVAATAGIEDFMLKDILEPKPRRLQKICSGLINYMMFRCDRLEFYENIRAENDALIQQRQKFESENNELQRRINEIKASRAQRAPQVEKLQEILEERRLSLEHERKQVAVAKKQAADVKARVAELKSGTAKLKELTAEAKEEADRLDSQIVESPDRRKSELERMRRQVEQTKMDEEHKLSMEMDMRKKLDAYREWDEDVSEACRLVASVAELSEKKKKGMAETAKITAQCQGHKDELRDFSMQVQQLKRMNATKQEKLSKLSLQHVSKMNAVQENIKLVDQEKKQIAHSEQDLEKELQKRSDFRSKMLKEEAEREKEHQKFIQLHKDKYQQLQQALEQYHSNFLEHWRAQGLDRDLLL